MKTTGGIYRFVPINLGISSLLHLRIPFRPTNGIHPSRASSRAQTDEPTDRAFVATGFVTSPLLERFKCPVNRPLVPGQEHLVRPDVRFQTLQLGPELTNDQLNAVVEAVVGFFSQ